MGTEGSRARSHAHAKRQGRFTVHFVVVALALLAVTFAARFPDSSSAQPTVLTPSFALSGLSGPTGAPSSAFLRPASGLHTRESVAALTATSNVASVRAAGGVSPVSSFTSGVSAAALSTGEQGAGIAPLADIVDPQRPFVVYTVESGDTAGVIAEKFGITLATLLDNNPTVDDDVLLVGQQLVVPRRDGILHKVGFGESVASIVAQYDNITAAQVIDYRPNAIGDPDALEQGKHLLLPGATVKPPPPPPPPPPASNPPTSGGGGSAPPGGGGGVRPPAPGGSGIFNLPLARWHGVSDPFGTPRGASYHTGVDFDLWGMHHEPVLAACSGQVVRTEWLTYSYGYHVIVDCGGGFSTLYAHFDRIDVSVGQWVTGGQMLGISGLTGYTTGEHLHFEIRVNGAPVDPQPYLGYRNGY